MSFLLAVCLPEQVGILQQYVVIAGIDLQRLFQVSFCAGKIAADAAECSPQTEIFHLVGAGNLQLGQKLLGNGRLLANGGIVLKVPVRLNQFQPNLRGVKHAFRRSFRHRCQRGKIFFYSVSVTVLNAGQLRADCMQPVVVGINLVSAGQECPGLIEIAHAQLGLCRRQLSVR